MGHERTSTALFDHLLVTRRRTLLDRCGSI
jgi:hypothetical protein